VNKNKQFYLYYLGIKQEKEEEADFFSNYLNVMLSQEKRLFIFV
jgi:hypothetical protein